MNMRLTLVVFLGCSDLVSVGEPVFDTNHDGEVKIALEHKPCVRVVPAGESKPKPVHPVVARTLVPTPRPQVNRRAVANLVGLLITSTRQAGSSASGVGDVFQGSVPHLIHCWFDRF